MDTMKALVWSGGSELLLMDRPLPTLQDPETPLSGSPAPLSVPATFISAPDWFHVQFPAWFWGMSLPAWSSRWGVR